MSKWDKYHPPLERKCPGCGKLYPGRQRLARHKENCEALEMAVYDEIDRIANELGRPPKTTEYDNLVSPKLPRYVWVYKTYGGWKEIGVKKMQQLQTRHNG